MGNKHKWYSILLIGLVILLASSVIGCPPQEPTPPPTQPVAPPVIVAFSANPTQISAGESATLLWNVTEATTVSIDQGIGIGLTQLGQECRQDELDKPVWPPE